MSFVSTFDQDGIRTCFLSRDMDIMAVNFLKTRSHAELTVENSDKGNGHHNESHQQISYSKRHQKVVCGILQLSFK